MASAGPDRELVQVRPESSSGRPGPSGGQTLVVYWIHILELAFPGAMVAESMFTIMETKSPPQKLGELLVKFDFQSAGMITNFWFCACGTTHQNSIHMPLT